jgi:hypothetical protein
VALVEIPNVEVAHAPYVTQMRGKWTAQQLFDAARAVEETVQSPGWKVIADLVGGAADQEDHRIKFGKTLEQAEYARAIGLVVGLQSPLLAAESVLAYAKQVESELEQRNAAEQAAGVN